MVNLLVPSETEDLPRDLQTTAARLAKTIYYGHGEQRLTELLIEFAEEIKRQAIEP